MNEITKYPASCTSATPPPAVRTPLPPPLRLQQFKWNYLCAVNLLNFYEKQKRQMKIRLIVLRVD